MGLGIVVRVLVTGAGGFIGKHVCRFLQERCDVRPAGRAQAFSVADIGPLTDWQAALEGVDAVVHLAGMAHVPDRSDVTQEAEFHRVNAYGTRRLAEQAIQAGVKRFVLLSSATVMGLVSPASGWTEEALPQPQNAYARSKLAAELALHNIGQGHAMDIHILRPPLVYGARVKANFRRLMALVATGLPLPLAGLHQPRDFLYVENLCSAIAAIVLEERIPAGTYFITDHHPLSTSELLRAIANAMGQRARLFPFPVSLLRIAAQLLGRRGEMERLSLPFRLQDDALRRYWQPPFSVAEGLDATVRDYQSHKNA